jgi:hypothetical protein
VIFDYLQKVWTIPLAHGSRVLALTVPEAGVKAGRSMIDAKRNKLNDLIKGYKHENL